MSRRGRSRRFSGSITYPSIAQFYGAGGIKLHWDAALGVTASSDRVSQWNDQTGNGNNFLQGTGANQPLRILGDTPGGTPCIHLDSAARAMSKNAGSTTQANASVTLFLVVKVASNGVRVYSHDNNAGTGGFRYDTTGGNRVGFFWGTSGVTDGAFSANYEVLCWRVAAAGGYGTSVTTKELYVNGVLQAAPAGSPNMTQGTGAVAIGAAGSSVNVKFAEIAEAPDSLISAADCIALSLGLMRKHGIT